MKVTQAFGGYSMDGTSNPVIRVQEALRLPESHMVNPLSLSQGSCSLKSAVNRGWAQG